MIEAEEIKTRAAAAKQKQALEREVLPSLKNLDEEESFLDIDAVLQNKASPSRQITDRKIASALRLAWPLHWLLRTRKAVKA